MQNTSKQVFVEKFETGGPEKFYIFLLHYVDARIKDGSGNKAISPEMELLNYSSQFLQIFRRENKEIYREISYCFRRAAHKAYRNLLNKKIIKQNIKFLSLVK